MFGFPVTPCLDDFFGTGIANLPALGFRSGRCLGVHTQILSQIRPGKWVCFCLIKKYIVSTLFKLQVIQVIIQIIQVIHCNASNASNESTESNASNGIDACSTINVFLKCFFWDFDTHHCSFNSILNGSGTCKPWTPYLPRKIPQ